MLVYEYLLNIIQKKGAGYLPLIDPDKITIEQAITFAEHCKEIGVDALLVGGSFLISNKLNELLRAIKKAVDLPTIIFPGGINQVSPEANAIFFLSLISGRNPEALIGEHVKAAPLLKAYNLEPISIGYMLIDSGRPTSALFMSNTQPIPRNKSDIAMAHALAAEYLGMKMIYLEAGSGAEFSVPDKMISAVKSYTSIPIIVGGGIRTPEEAYNKVKAGANFIVTGTILEDSQNSKDLLAEFTEAIHNANQESGK